MTARHHHVPLLLVAGATAVGLLGACSNDTGTYKEETEEFIAENEDVRAQYETTFSDVTCDEPASTETGEQYTCTAKDAAGGDWVFDAEIDAENSFEVVGTKQE